MSGNIGGANIKIGGDESGLITSITNARKQFSLFTREINSNVAQSYKNADAEQKVFRGGLVRLGSELTSVGQKLSLITTLPALYAAGNAYKDYANIQRMEKGLSLYGETLEDIRRLAKEPNIGVFDGAKSLVGLRAAKIDAELAERAVRSFANAIAAAGGNSADLEPALLNLKQFKATQNINQVDLRQLSARIPQAMDIIQKQFGTLDTEKLNKIGIDKFIEGFVSGLEKLPKVAGGAGVAMEQVSDSFTFFSATVGESLDKAFNVTGKISSLGEMLDGLATNFKTLTPEGQKAILMFGGMAIVIPPLIVAVGGLIKLWPVLAGAIGGISWPVVAIGATAAAIAGLVAIVPLLSNNVADLNKQQAIVSGFDEKLKPLIEKYDELSGKTKLTADEQKTLKDVTKQIADLVPVAVTGWDKYSNAIDVNTNKVKTFTSEQRKLLESMQATRREALLLENQKSDLRKAELQSSLSSGQTKTRVNLGMGVYQDQVHTLNSDEIRKVSAQLATLQQQDIKNRKELLSIGGAESYQKDVIELRALVKERIQLKKDYAVALKGDDFNLSESLRIKSDAVGEAIKEKRERIKLSRDQTIQARRELRSDNAIPEMKENSVNIAKSDAAKVYVDSDAHKKYLQLLKDEKGNLEAIRDIAKDIVKINGSATLSGHELNAFSTDPENQRFQTALADKKADDAFKDRKKEIAEIAALSAPLSAKDSIKNTMDSSLESYRQKNKEAVEATKNLNQELQNAFSDTALNVGAGFGEMLGNMASGVDGVETFSQRLMGALGNMLKQMGKALIAAGIGGSALKKLMSVPALAIPAGIAMVALGQALSNSMSKSVSTATRTRLANGGAVFGPTRVIVGDNDNARNDPELVAPYSKVHASFKKIAQETGGYGQGGGYEQIRTVVRGEDIEIIHKRITARNKALGIA